MAKLKDNAEIDIVAKNKTEKAFKDVQAGLRNIASSAAAIQQLKP